MSTGSYRQSSFAHLVTALEADALVPMYRQPDEGGDPSPSPAEVRLAADLGLDATLLDVGPEGVRQLHKLLAKLGISSDELGANSDLLSVMERVCADCSSKARCDHDQAHGATVEAFCRYCPNGPPIRELLRHDERHDG